MTLDRAEAERLLAELARRLAAEGVDVRIHVLGGAAVMLTSRPDRVATADVDSWINCGARDDVRSAVLDAAAAIARETPGLGDDWLNEDARLFLPLSIGGAAEEWRPLIRVGGVEIVIAPPEVLLVMKLRAGRGRRDLPDAAVLIRECGLSSVAEVEALYERHFPYDDMSDRSRAWLASYLSA